MAGQALDRLDHLYITTTPENTKSEAEAARALETLVKVSRTSLGMDVQEASTPGPLTLNILTNQAAVQVKTA